MESPEAVAERQRAAAEAAAATEEAVVHEDNEWAIEVLPEDAKPSAAVAEESAAQGGSGGSGGELQGLQALPEGLQFSHVSGIISPWRRNATRSQADLHSLQCTNWTSAARSLVCWLRRFPTPCRGSTHSCTLCKRLALPRR